MQQRTMEIVAAAVGLLAVVGLVIIGMDIRSAAKRGPRWRRRLLAAGLASLGLIGASQEEGTTCYDVSSVEPIQAPTFERLEQQVALLDQLTSGDKLDPEVVRKTLAAAEAVLAEAGKEDIEDRARAEELRLSVRRKMECIRARLEGGRRPLADSADWQKLTAVMDEAKAVAGGQMGDYPFDEAGKKRLLASIDEAVGTVDRLVKDGFLIDTEATLLKDDLKDLRSGVEKKRPVEDRMATCYEPMAVEDRHPAVRLKARLPLLEKMAAEKKLDPSVLRRALASVEADLAAIEADPESANTRDAVKAQLEKLKKLAETPSK